MKIATRILQSDKWKITSRYGWRIHPVTKLPSFHSGIDYGTNREYWAIYGLENGIVTASGINATDGNYIWVEYPRIDLKLFHGHLLNRSVFKNDMINEYTILGKVGKSGRADGTHLHLGVRKISTNKYFDFENYEYIEEEKEMINTRTITYLGQTVHIIEAKQDLSHDVQISVIADKFTKKLLNEFHDTELEEQGWERAGIINGGLFFSEGLETFADGIEITQGIVHENDDVKLDNVLGFYHKNDVPFIVTQSYIKRNLSGVRGALIGAFGLTNNGLTDTRGRTERSSIFNAKSGRSIVGKKADGTIVLASFKGVTGQSGLTGLQTVQLAKWLGLRNSVCLDGGGSVCSKFYDKVLIDSTRPIKNAVAIYVKKRHDFNVGDVVSINGEFTIERLTGNQAFLKELSAYVDFKYLSKKI